MTPQEQAAWNAQAYGDAKFPERIAEAINDGAAMLSNPVMIAMSMLSDAQEEIERDMKERARQTINRAKHVISQFLAEKSTVEALRKEVNHAAGCTVYEIPGHPRWGSENDRNGAAQ